MPDCIHADVDAMHSPGLKSMPNAAATYPQPDQLPVGDHTVLSRRKFRHPPVTWAI